MYIYIYIHIYCVVCLFLVVDELDGAHRVARRCAFRGHMHVMAKRAATTADGTITFAVCECRWDVKPHSRPV